MVLSHTQKLQSEHNCNVLRGYSKTQMQKLHQQKMNGKNFDTIQVLFFEVNSLYTLQIENLAFFHHTNKFN